MKHRNKKPASDANSGKASNGGSIRRFFEIVIVIDVAACLLLGGAFIGAQHAGEVRAHDTAKSETLNGT